VKQCETVCCGVRQYQTVRGSVMECEAVKQCETVCCGVRQYQTVRGSVMECEAVCCSVLQYVAV